MVQKFHPEQCLQDCQTYGGLKERRQMGMKFRHEECI